MLRRVGVAQSSEGDNKTRNKYINTNSGQFWQKHQDALVAKGKASGGVRDCCSGVVTIMLKWSEQKDAVVLGRQRRPVQAEKDCLFWRMVVHGHPGIVHRQ